MKLLRVAPIVALAVSGLVVAPGAAGASQHGRWHTHDHGHSTYTCASGTIPAGTYSSVVVTGICYAPIGTITVRGDLRIAPGALLDGVTAGDPASAPVLPATVVVGGNVWVGAGGVLALGCSPLGGCTGVTYDRIEGNVTAIGAEAVLLQAVTIWGNVSIIGGGGGVAGGASSAGCFDPSYAIPAPWSLDSALSNPSTGSPQYTDIEDSTIGGNLKILGVQTCYLASFRDRVWGNVSFAGNTTSDPDGNELGSNTVGGHLGCQGDNPAVQFGDAAAAPNVVEGHAVGECGFSVVLNNAGSNEHISVKASALSSYTGTHVATPVQSIPFGTTASGESLTGQLNDMVLAGSGLTGTATVNPSGPIGQSGEVVVGTVHTDGSSSFEAIVNCACSFKGQSGAVQLFFYGTTTSAGVTQGHFVVASGGLGGGGLGTLAGNGWFSSKGQPSGTLGLVERLALT